MIGGDENFLLSCTHLPWPPKRKVGTGGQVAPENPGVGRSEKETGNSKKALGYDFSIYNQVDRLAKLSHGHPGVREGGPCLEKLGIISQTPGHEEKPCASLKQAGCCSWMPWRRS